MPSGRGVVTDRHTCHHVSSACGSKNAASTRVGAALMSSECSNSGEGSGVPDRAIRGQGTLSREGTRVSAPSEPPERSERAAPRAGDAVGEFEQRSPSTEHWDEHYADER